jgi:hypothetical protein
MDPGGKLVLGIVDVTLHSVWVWAKLQGVCINNVKS